MIVITLTDCPPKLRGDLSKWLCEINTGVFVGNLNSRVRDALWERVCEHVHTGRATMVFHTNNEQQMDFRVHNTTWKPIDLDGIHLMKRPLPKGTTADVLPEGFSKAAHYQKAQRMQAARTQKTTVYADYTVIDLETSGLHAETDEILELGAIRIRNQDCIEKFSVLLKNNRPIPQKVAQLTGITEQVLQQEGIALSDGLRAFLDFIGNDMLVGHNLQFDFSFLREACRQSGLKMPTNRCRDTLDIARKRLKGIQNYKLATLAEHFSLDAAQAHRVLPDCDTTHKVYQKLQQK